jgi:hypothetical protein
MRKTIIICDITGVIVPGGDTYYDMQGEHTNEIPNSFFRCEVYKPEDMMTIMAWWTSMGVHRITVQANVAYED